MTPLSVEPGINDQQIPVRQAAPYILNPKVITGDDSHKNLLPRA
jgi:hypothetical protein